MIDLQPTSAVGRDPTSAPGVERGHCRPYAGRQVETDGEAPMNFRDRRMDGAEFRNCSMANAVFDDVNLSGARLTNVNLSGLSIENANIKGLKIFGYDVESWIRAELAKDGCHLD